MKTTLDKSYYIAFNGETAGPYTLYQLREMVKQGSIPRSTPVYLDNWVPMHSAGEMFAFARISSPKECSDLLAYFKCDGRIGRMEYLVRVIIQFFSVMAIGGILLFFIDAFERSAPILSFLSALLCFVLFAFSGWLLLATNAKRVHDFGSHGLCGILGFVPIVFFIFCLIPGSTEKNKYGYPSEAWFKHSLNP